MQGKGSSGPLSTTAKSCSWGHPCGLVGISLTPGLSLTANDSLYNHTFFIALPLRPFPIMTPIPSCSQLSAPASMFRFPVLLTLFCTMFSPRLREMNIRERIGVAGTVPLGGPSFHRGKTTLESSQRFQKQI